MTQAPIAYNEYKFLVPNEQLFYIRDLLQSFYGRSDPFPEGVVDSVYFDNYNLSLYQKCMEGEQVKDKFRVRGYGDGRFVQVHFKQKDMFGVRKLKCKIKPLDAGPQSYPDWERLLPNNPADAAMFAELRSHALPFGLLVPVLRVKYYRYRFRVNDYRITLDTRIEITSLANGIDTKLDYVVLPNHVLEVKTTAERPYLPLLGVASLPQISFSKFYLGLNALTTGDAE